MQARNFVLVNKVLKQAAKEVGGALTKEQTINLQDETDEAIRLFSDKDASETIFIAPYKEQVEAFNEAVIWMRGINQQMEPNTRLF